MKVFFEEIVKQTDKMEVAHHFWYMDVTLTSIDSKKHKVLDISGKTMQKIIEEVRCKMVLAPTVYWYFYDKETSWGDDTFYDDIHTSLMIGKSKNSFAVHFNISEYNFSLSFEEVLAYKRKLESDLKELLDAF